MHNVEITSVEKILKNLNVVKATRIDQISSKFIKGDVPVTAIHLFNIINLSIKLDNFPSKWKIAKMRLFFKKGIKTEAEKYRPICLLPLTSKVIEKKFMIKLRIIFKEMKCCTVTNQVLEQTIPQIRVCLSKLT